MQILNAIRLQWNLAINLFFDILQLNIPMEYTQKTEKRETGGTDRAREYKKIIASEQSVTKAAKQLFTF